MKKKTINQLIKIIFIVVLVLGGYTVYEHYDSDTIKIANWNLQIFGQTKADNIELMQTYSSIIYDYDIIFIHEIRDKEQTAFPRLCSMLQNYSCISSSRAGRTSSKEQYGVIYKNEINLTSFQDYNPDPQDRWERPPIKTIFDVNDYSLIVYNIHTKPDDVQHELYYLEEVVSDIGNVLILGDLNADCSYYNNEKQAEFDDWNWVIKDDEDTTVSATHCAYDRIILNENSYEEYIKDGIYKQGITKDVSDHYLVWVELEV
jgi:endonuclease/exonuclease/phosphatase family metal-dependent hydrolase